MLKDVSKIVALVCVLGVLAEHSPAQRGGGGGGSRGGGPGGRGGGGMCSRSSGETTAATETQSGAAGLNFLANSGNRVDRASQLANMQRQRTQRFQNNGVTANASSRNRPTSAQFAQAAFRFDTDSDGELNSTELSEVATAVIQELQTYQSPRGFSTGGNASASIHRSQAGGILPNASMQELTAAFVSKALTFDRDDSGTLDAAETRALASAFIRSLG